MQVQNRIKQIDSLIPYTQPYSCFTLEKKHWYILASAEIMIPQLTFSLKVTQVLLMFDCKIYLSIEIAVIPMMAPSQLQIHYKSQKHIEGYHPIQGHPQQKAIGSGLYELPICARCLVGYSCNSHCKK